MYVLYTTENLNTRRNLPFKKFYEQNINCIVLNKQVNLSIDIVFKKNKYLKLFQIFFLKIFANIQLLKKLKGLNEIKKILVLYPGYVDIIFLNLFYRKKREKIIYDNFVSLYQTLVIDRKIIKSKCLIYIIYKIEKYLNSLPQLMIVETELIKDYLNKLFNSKLNIDVLITPTDKNIFDFTKLNNNQKKEIDFLYWGSYINLHGLENLIYAAEKNLDKHKIYMLGDGQEYNKVFNLAKELKLKNIIFDKTMFVKENKYEKFFNLVSSSKFAIGALSDSEKNNIVIPSKVIEAAALKLPIITYFSSCITVYSMENNAYYLKYPNAENLSFLMNDVIEKYLNETYYKKIEEAYSWFKKYGSYETFNQNLFKILNK